MNAVKSSYLSLFAVGNYHGEVAIAFYQPSTTNGTSPCWEDITIKNNQFVMMHIRRGGSNGTPKDKDERFVPVHPIVANLMGPVKKKAGPVFENIKERQLLKRLKELCQICRFENPREYKLHSFRHHFASICANHRVAYRKALAWLGHSSSQMLDLYYHLHDEDSQQAMVALAESDAMRAPISNESSTFEGNLRANSQSKIEKTLQLTEVKELVECLSDVTERAGFEPAVPINETRPFQDRSISHSDTSP